MAFPTQSPQLKVEWSFSIPGELSRNLCMPIMRLQGHLIHSVSDPNVITARGYKLALPVWYHIILSRYLRSGLMSLNFPLVSRHLPAVLPCRLVWGLSLHVFLHSSLQSCPFPPSLIIVSLFIDFLHIVHCYGSSNIHLHSTQRILNIFASWYLLSIAWTTWEHHLLSNTRLPPDDLSIPLLLTVSLWTTYTLLTLPTMSFSVLSLNAKDLNHPAKCSSLWKTARSLNCDVLCVQETHFAQDLSPVCRHKRFPHVFSSLFKKKQRGVLIAIRDTVSFEPQSCMKDPESRFIILICTINGVQYTLVLLYALNQR